MTRSGADGTLARIQLAVTIALGTLQTGGACGGACPDHVERTAFDVNAPDAAPASPPPPGPLSAEECAKRCTAGGVVASCRSVLEDAQVLLECTYRRSCGGAGRRHAGLVVRGRGLLARSAALESASVESFRRLRDELASLGAPVRLLTGCERAARDEVRHAESVGELARRAGERPCRVSTRPRRARSAFALARENAAEGCVGEAWGALLAATQAELATDPSTRRTMRVVAADEARHAALSFEIDAWLDARLTRKQRAAIERVKRARARRIVREASRTPRVVSLGLPGSAAATMAAALFSSLGL